MSNYNTIINRILSDIAGVTAVAVVNGTAGKLLACEGTGTDFATLTGGIVALYNFKARISRALLSKEPLEFFFFSLKSQQHIFFPIPMQTNVFIYVAIDKSVNIPTTVISKLRLIAKG